MVRFFYTAAAALSASTALASPDVKYSFTFVGDGDQSQAPKTGCFEQDNGCRSCLQAWFAHPPDASYVYHPIVAQGCAGKKEACSFCPPGLTLYTYKPSCSNVKNLTVCNTTYAAKCEACTVNGTMGCNSKAAC